VKPSHYRGRYHVQARKLRAQAAANPNTVCWRCGRTLQEHPRHRNGRPPYWTAGHLVDGMRDGALLPEVSVCNYAAGGRLARARERQTWTSRPW
jgi:hypothetical protein